MTSAFRFRALVLLLTITAVFSAPHSSGAESALPDGRYLYVAVPSLGRQPERGGRGSRISAEPPARSTLAGLCR